jgi:hypothetical protein
MTAASIILQRIRAVFLKELVQMRRDRMTFAMMFMVPIMQLVLFGYAVNTNPKRLPTAILTEEHQLFKGLRHRTITSSSNRPTTLAKAPICSHAVTLRL